MYLITPISEVAKEWVKANVCLESWQWMCDSFAVDHHYIEDLVSGMLGDGLTMEDDFTVSHA
jgi:hypothetical protein